MSRNVISVINSFPWRLRGMAIKTVLYTAKYRWLLLHRPFKSFSGDLGELSSEPLSYTYAREDMLLIYQIGQVVESIANVTPWKSECLVQAFAAKKILAKHKIPCNVFLGVCNSEDANEPMLAHAWVKCGEMIVTGAVGHEKFTVTSVFCSKSK